MKTPGKHLLKPDMTILFQGDSITDRGRDRNDPHGLGSGYAFMVASQLAARFSQLNLSFYNRGISGDRMIDLLNRWDKDCIELKPGLVSILVGINDTWRRFDSNDPTPVEHFEKRYREILTRTREELNPLFVIGEPFVLPVPEDRKAWREDLDPRIHVVRELAREFDAIYIPYDGIFAAASSYAPPEYWAADGVHPTMAGHALMANAWLRHVIGKS